MESKELSEGIGKKPRSADLHKSLKSLSASLKSDIEGFLKVPVTLDPSNAKLSSISSTLDSIARSLDSLLPAPRIKFLREDPSLLNTLFRLLAVLCHTLEQEVVAESAAKQGIVLITSIGTMLQKRVIAEGYAFESLVKTLIKAKAVETLLSAVGLCWKLINNDGTKMMSFKLFNMYSELIYTMIQHSNEDSINEFSKFAGHDKLKKWLKASYEHKQYEGYCYLLNLLPIVVITPVETELFAILRDHLTDSLSKDDCTTTVSPIIMLGLRAILSQSKDQLKKWDGIDKLEHEVAKLNKQFLNKGLKNKSFCCSAYLLFEIWSREGLRKSSLGQEEQKDGIEEKVTWKQHLDSELRNYQAIKSELNTIKIKHYDCPQVESSLSKVQKLINQVRSFRY